MIALGGRYWLACVVARNGLYCVGRTGVRMVMCSCRNCTVVRISQFQKDRGRVVCGLEIAVDCECLGKISVNMRLLQQYVEMTAV